MSNVLKTISQIITLRSVKKLLFATIHSFFKKVNILCNLSIKQVKRIQVIKDKRKSACYYIYISSIAS